MFEGAAVAEGVVAEGLRGFGEMECAEIRAVGEHVRADDVIFREEYHVTFSIGSPPYEHIVPAVNAPFPDRRPI